MYNDNSGPEAVVLRAIDIILSDLSQSPMEVAHKVGNLMRFYRRAKTRELEETAQALVDLL